MKKLLIILLILGLGTLMSPTLIFARISTSELLTCTNSYRTENVKLDPVLSYVARVRLRDMVINDYFAHQNPITKLMAWDIMDRIGYNYIAAGENLARGFKESEDVCTAWMNSKSHRDNMVSRDYDRVGFAVRGAVVVQIFSN